MKSVIINRYLIFVIAWFISLIDIFPFTTLAVESMTGLPHHHLALFTGLGAETRRDTPDEKGFAFGLNYELRFHEHWGVGAGVEGLGQDTIRNIVVVVPVSFHPTNKWRLFAGPGIEFTPKKDKFMVRLGLGYEFPISGHWSLSPEIIGDFIDGGSITWLGGLAIGYEF